MSAPRAAGGALSVVRRLLGLRRTIRGPGVRYRELDADPLDRALSRRGPGVKEYRARFTAGRGLRIRCSTRRCYADLNGPLLLEEYRLAEPGLRPGMRVLLLRAGTGYAADWVAGRVGPSGAVVALEADAESTRYARRRYPAATASFEAAGIDGLSGELDGAFDAVLAVRALRSGDDPAAVVKELWRVLAPGGFLLLTAPRKPDADQPRTGRRRDPPGDPPEPVEFSPGGLRELVARACAVAGIGPAVETTGAIPGSVAVVAAKPADRRAGPGQSPPGPDTEAGAGPG